MKTNYVIDLHFIEKIPSKTNQELFSLCWKKILRVRWKAGQKYYLSA